MNYLLDTNVVSEAIRPDPDTRVRGWVDSNDEGRLFLSAVSVAELHRGVCLMPKGRKRNELHHWLHEDLMRRFEGRIVGVTADIAVAWGDMMGLAKAGGFGLAIMDCFIAATAKTRSMTLVTRNTRDFTLLKIDLLNPWLSESHA